MNAITFTCVVWAISMVAGFLGALTGLGGGVVVVPALTLALGVDMKYAIGASLVSVIATSSGAAAAYLRGGYSNIRIGMFLEIATTVGAIVGAFLAGRFSTHALAIIFGFVLIQAAFQSISKSRKPGLGPVESDTLGHRLRLGGTFPRKGRQVAYGVRNAPAGFGLMFGAGALSGLLGIGSGAVKVIAMDRTMKIPFKVSTTTSNFMIGVTAAASAGVYLSRGYIDPRVAMPVMLGVLGGAFLGSKVLVHAPVRILRIVFAAVILALAVEMIVSGILGKGVTMDDRRLENTIGNLLRIGVLTAAGVVTVGGIVYLLQNIRSRVDYHHFVAPSASTTTVSGIMHSAASFQSEGIIQLGLLLLIATPVARVLLAITGFALERDWLYVAVSLIVFVVLLVSLLHAT